MLAIAQPKARKFGLGFGGSGPTLVGTAKQIHAELFRMSVSHGPKPQTSLFLNGRRVTIGGEIIHGRRVMQGLLWSIMNQKVSALEVEA